MCDSAAVRLDIDFMLRGAMGRVRVELEAAADAASSGRGALDPYLPPEDGAELPMCTAFIDYAGVGYAAAMGWVQFVRSSDSQRPETFELDPLALFDGVNTPYAFFGMAPTLFDAPYRGRDADLTWQARSYLAVSPDGVVTRAAAPIVAFSWGFRVHRGHVAIDAPTRFETAKWEEHLEVLETAHPGWDFRSPPRP